jgi:hypothetical protein
MSLIIWKNNASSTMASGITNVATQVTVQAGQGALFPSPSAGQYSVITLEDVSGNIEIVQCTGRTGDTLTIVRAQESTTGLAFASGSRVENRITAGVLAALLQKTSDTLADTTISGIVTMGGGGSIRGGELVGTAMRGTAGDTSNQIFVPASPGNPYIGPSSTNPILTKNNLTANLPSGTSLVVTGCIFFWNGTTGTIPSGYVLCDGINPGTPNLLDKMIMGAGSTYPVTTTGGSTSTTTALANGAAATTGSYVLTTADIPSHSHKVFTRTGSINGAGGGTSLYSIGHDSNGGGTDNGGASETSGGAGGHSHTIGSVSHQHTYTLPPYRAVVPIMRA